MVVAAIMALVVSNAMSGEAKENRPKVVSLPDEFQPEGIATKGANAFFVGSIPTGDIFKGDLRVADSDDDVFIDAPDGRSAIGLSLRKGVLFVAGGLTGQAYAYNARNGEELGTFQLTTDETFVNDVVATRKAAYFTDSVNQRLYRVPIEGKGEFGAPEVLSLTGDIVFVEGFNANGIDATRNGKTLVLVQSNTGKLFTVDPETGSSTEIDLDGNSVTNGDGILLDGRRRLWVVQNQDNLLTLVRLSSDLSEGEIVDRFTDETFDVPTTVARAGDRLAIVNARFREGEPESEYWVTQIRRPR
jgi:sugar lactone lactonase YvrE